MNETCHRKRISAIGHLASQGRGGFGGSSRAFVPAGTAAHYPPDRAVVLRHVALEIEVHMHARRVEGVCRLHLVGAAALTPVVHVDAARLLVRGVARPDGGTTSFEYDGAQIRVLFDPPIARGEQVELAIDYEVQSPPAGLYFVGPDEAEPDKPRQAWTQNQDEDAKYWMPSFDSPNAKATFELIAVADSEYRVLSNGSLLDRSDRDDGRTRWHWAISTPHAAYLYTMVVGAFSEHVEQVGSLPVAWYVPAGREEDGIRAFGRTPDMVRFFSEFTGVPYPYEKYAQVAVADFVFGGMENASMTSQTDRVLTDEAALLAYDPDDLVAHELAHQWFGDYVTCRQWSHAWLNEGFATYCESLYREHANGRDDADYHLLQAQRGYLEEDKSDYRRPIVCHHYEEPIDLFDRHLYEKGALVLHMLRAELGDAGFRDSIRTYLEHHALGHVESSDLMRAIERATGRSLDRFFAQWVYASGYPELQVEWEHDAARGELIVRVQQTQVAPEGSGTSGTAPFHFHVDVEWESADRVEVRTLAIENAQHTFRFAVDAAPTRAGFDPKGSLLAATTTKMPLPWLCGQATQAATARARIDAIGELARTHSREAVDTLDVCARTDPFWAVRVEAVAALGRLPEFSPIEPLRAAASDEYARVRLAAVKALGALRTGDVADVFRRRLEPETEPSYHVRAAAAAAWGASRADGARQELQARLDSAESWNDIVRVGILDGLGELASPESERCLAEWTKGKATSGSRGAAAKALAKLGRVDADSMSALCDLAERGPFRAQLAAIDALAELGDPRGMPSLGRVFEAAVDGRIRRRARLARERLSERVGGASTPMWMGEIGRLQDQVKSLTERLEKLEQRRSLS